MKKHLLTKKDITLKIVFIVKCFLPVPLEVQYMDVLEKPVRFLTLDFKAKLITSESTFRRSLYGMILDKMLNSKVEINVAFFLTLILFSLVTIGK